MYVCTDGWMYVCKISSASKVNLRFSNENAMTDFHKTWYVGSGGAQVLPTWSVVTEYAYLIPHSHICSDWLITKKSNIQSSVWATLMKLGMWTWILLGTSTNHVVCRHQMHIFSTSFAYLFRLANNKKVKYPEFCMDYINETWYMGSDGQKYYPCGLSSPNAYI